MIENFACSLERSEWEGIENFKRFLNRKIETDDEILIEINSVGNQCELYFPDSVNNILKKYWIFISKFRTLYINCAFCYNNRRIESLWFKSNYFLYFKDIKVIIQYLLSFFYK